MFFLLGLLLLVVLGLLPLGLGSVEELVQDGVDLAVEDFARNEGEPVQS